MIKYYLIAAFTITFTSSFSQQNYKAAWCVTQYGDTLHGQILFKDWNISPSEITFLDSTSHVETIYGVSQIRMFALKHNNFEDVFESKTVRITKFSQSPGEFGKNTTTTEIVTRFVELKFQSEIVSLYELTDDKEVLHYLLLKDSVLTELVYGSSILVRNGKSYQVFNTEYKKQLKELLYECPTLDVTNVDYTAKSLLKLLTLYHSYCKVDYRILYKNDAGLKFSLGLGSQYYFLTDTDGDYIHSFNLSIRVLLPKRFNNTFVYIEGGRIGNGESYLTQFGIFGGTYFGKGERTFLPFLYGGITYPQLTVLGGGLSFKKYIDLAVQTQVQKNPIVCVSVKFYPFTKGNTLKFGSIEK